MRPTVGRLKRTPRRRPSGRPIEEEKNDEEADCRHCPCRCRAQCRLAGAAAAETANIWVRADGSNFMPRIVDAFNKSHKNQIKLDIIPNAEIIPKYGAAAAGGTAPDALSLDLIYTPAFSASGQLEDITDWAKSLPYFDSLSPAHVENRHV